MSVCVRVVLHYSDLFHFYVVIVVNNMTLKSRWLHIKYKVFKYITWWK